TGVSPADAPMILLDEPGPPPAPYPILGLDETATDPPTNPDPQSVDGILTLEDRPGERLPDLGAGSEPAEVILLENASPVFPASQPIARRGRGLLGLFRARR
ncbi:MAG: hypothetical protein ACRDG4_17500, partial [Chloroflexota bacterium]